MGKSINKIVKYLEENMTVYKEGNESKKKRVRKKESMEITKSRWNVSNDEVIWTSSLIYIGNLPFAMTEDEIAEFVMKFHIKPSQEIKRRNYSLIRFRSDLNKLIKKINKMNGIFFRGAMVTVNLFERNQNKNKNRPTSRSLNMENDENKKESIPGQQFDSDLNDEKKSKEVILPNNALFVNNFDVKPGIYDVLSNAFVRFGELSNNVKIGVDKFGDPYAKILYFELNDAIKCYEAANSLNNSIKIGMRTLRVEYSKFVQQKNCTGQGRAYKNNKNGLIRPKVKRNHHTQTNGNYQNGHSIRPQANNGTIRPQAQKKQGRAKRIKETKPKRKRIKKNNKESNVVSNDSDGWTVKGRKKKNRKRNK